MLKEHAEEAFANWKDCLNIINGGGTCIVDGIEYDIKTKPQVLKNYERFQNLITALAHVTAWELADEKLATAQIYSFSTPSGARTVHRSDAESVRAQLRYWQYRAASLDPSQDTNPLSHRLGREVNAYS